MPRAHGSLVIVSPTPIRIQNHPRRTHRPPRHTRLRRRRRRGTRSPSRRPPLLRPLLAFRLRPRRLPNFPNFCLHRRPRPPPPLLQFISHAPPRLQLYHRFRLRRDRRVYHYPFLPLFLHLHPHRHLYLPRYLRRRRQLLLRRHGPPQHQDAREAKRPPSRVSRPRGPFPPRRLYPPRVYLRRVSPRRRCTSPRPRRPCFNRLLWRFPRHLHHQRHQHRQQRRYHKPRRRRSQSTPPRAAECGGRRRRWQGCRRPGWVRGRGRWGWGRLCPRRWGRRMRMRLPRALRRRGMQDRDPRRIHMGLRPSRPPSPLPHPHPSPPPHQHHYHQHHYQPPPPLCRHTPPPSTHPHPPPSHT
ncbi:hypothetical protein DFH06DRAFT_536931 [Mycena polygramma]|nr:hypothetical protein DFH06DRAFT_536931 [Mycena polygramma]